MNFCKFVYFFLCFTLASYVLTVNAKSQLTDLNETTWTEMLNGEWFIQFYAPWCPACKQLAPIWQEFSEWSEDLGIKVGQVDVTSNPGLSGRFMITALPTVYHAKDGVFRQYNGPRDKDALFSFIEEKKWHKIEPVSRWSSPQSIPMSTVSYFFQLSMTLRDMHNYLTGEVGFHSWVAHAVFGIATVLTGVLLGLLVVAIIDCMYSVRRLMSSSSQNKDLNEGQDTIGESSDMQPLLDEGIEDDEEPVLLSKANVDDQSKNDTFPHDGSGDTSMFKSKDILDNGDLKPDSQEFTELESQKIVHRKVARSHDSPPNECGDGS